MKGQLKASTPAEYLAQLEESRRADVSQAAHVESKKQDEKAKLDLRITKLIDQGYSIDSVAKRVGVSVRRVNTALDSSRRP